MADRVLDRLLVTLDVAVEAFAICEVRRGLRLVGRGIDAIEIHYVLQGTMHLMVPGAETIVCGPGSVVIIPPRVAQSITCDGAATGEVIAAENCSMVRDGLLLFDAADGGAGDLRIVCGVIMASISGSFGLLDKVTDPIVENVSDIEIVRQAYAIMLDEISHPGLGTRALAGALMKTCLVMVLRRYFDRAEPGSTLLGALQDPRLGRAVSAVIDRPANAHTVASLASAAGMSRSTFAREFRSAFSMSPMEFVAKTRLHHAAEMLRSTNVAIKVIAGSIGFSSRSHFSRAFRDAYGTDPSNFRKTITKPELDAPRNLRGSRERFALSDEPENLP